jgi:hypothetical protein
MKSKKDNESSCFAVQNFTERESTKNAKEKKSTDAFHKSE